MRRARALTAVWITVILVTLTGCTAKSGMQNTAAVSEDTERAELWYRESFDKTQNEECGAAYDAFVNSAASSFSGEPAEIRAESGDLLEIPVEEIDSAYQGFLYDHPELFWLGRSYNYRVSRSGQDGEYADAVLAVPLVDSEEKLEEYNSEFESAAQEFIDEALKAGSDRERAKLIYDRLSQTTEYVEEALYDESLYMEHTAYGAIVSKRAVCDGFALAYKYLLERCGIRCIVIPGESEGSPHVWNTVYWDGMWHEVDVTWDAASKGNNKGQYFDLTTVEMSKDHHRETEKIADLAPLSE